ncbi:XRE family transcriptional regulator [Rhizobiaceae bacterium BDR2-2]|uniref:XRE family transcriptional regulator n=1 Tax=Ectorhizobium quercum TaxID=2965071 RepID=A0AAE3N0Q7_9HYPH|nr:XRE family transcriptional regulator [Ectorhizobium quercum]MCX8998006.1 XRE family transcriptional regulator [Ectorhizobium quercum]
MENDTELNQRIAFRLKALRTAKRLTLDELAGLSGVSRAMISRIERGDASPTATLLSRIVSAFGLSLSAFFEEAERNASPLARRAGQPVWRDPETGYVRRSVSPAGMPARADIVEVEFPPGGTVSYPSLSGQPAMVQHVWLFSGLLDMTADGATHRMQPGDCLFMTLSTPHAFHNPGPGPARYAVIIEKPA